MRTFAEIVDLFGLPESEADGSALVHCPAHSDSNASLVVSANADGRVLLHCRAGCTFADVIAAAGLKPADLRKVDVTSLPTVPAPVSASTADRAQSARRAALDASRIDERALEYLQARFGIGAALAASLGLGSRTFGSTDRVTVPCFTAAGEIAFVQGRALGDHSIRWCGEVNPSGRHWDAAGLLGRVRNEALPVVVTEGPSDGLAVVATGRFEALVVRGAANAKHVESFVDFLRGRTVIVAGDGDDAGRKFNADVVSALRGLRVAVATLPDGEDLASLARMDVELMERVLDESMEDYEMEDDYMAEAMDAMPDLRWHCKAPEWSPKQIVERWLDHTGHRILFWRGGFYRWQDGVWMPWEDGKLNATLWADMSKAYNVRKVPNENGKMRSMQCDFEVTGGRKNGSVGQLFAALEAIRFRDTALPVDRAMVFRNGTLDVSTGILGPHAPTVFNLHKVDADYDPRAECPEWLAFIGSSLPEPEQQARLQEIVGYLLSGRQDLHKIVGLWGRPRSGKSTIMRVVGSLLGGHAMASPSLASLCSGFGLADCRDASVIMIGEARFTKHNKHAADILLKVSGMDPVEVNVKYRPAFSAVLPGRIVMVSNELPNIMEDSGAFASRFEHLAFNVSFLGCEDLDLERRLMLEKAGVVNWAMQGLRRLDENCGRFTESSESAALDRRLNESANHVLVWFQDRVFTGDPEALTPSAALWADYLDWCEENYVEEMHQSSEMRLGRTLTAWGVGSARSKTERLRKGAQLRQPREPRTCGEDSIMRPMY